MKEEFGSQEVWTDRQTSRFLYNPKYFVCRDIHITI